MRQFLRSASIRFGCVAFSLFLTISLLSRLALLFASRHDVSWDASLVGAFATGALFDAACAVFAAVPWLLAGALMPRALWKNRTGKVLLASMLTLFVGILIFITTAEWFFWDEFGARFNFIAVDYLIWTQEVLGNITESYPMGPIFAGITALAGGIVWLLARKGILTWAADGEGAWQGRVGAPLVGLGLCGLAVLGLNQASIPAFTNQFHGELAKNGCWSFLAAFRQMELEYTKWYVNLPQEQARQEAKQLLATPEETSRSSDAADLHRVIGGRGSDHRWNVILVCMESMSGQYLSYVGSKKSGLTPNLDRLAKESLFFDNLYATGTRTVRGMEALTLNLPPTPGHAIIYRPEGTNLTTTFTPFRDRGYDCAFFYGGDGRFDFMNRYFSTSGCRIMDVNAWKKEDVTMKTSWGACDEDLFNKTIAEADADHAAGKPFHYFCMTTSNHRPYDFPAGRIDMKPHGRRAAVKYADWAVGHLIEEARKHPWFDNTLFVIVSDHCASSAGKTEIDVTKYRIPAMIYNPKLVPAGKVSTLCSQIDVMPTVFGLLNWDYETLSYGHDLLEPSAASRPGRAFVSNYQKIGLLTEDGIAILKPNRKVSAYSCDRSTGAFASLDPAVSDKLVHDATVFYQSASWLFESGGLKLCARPPALSQR